jgi:hypothetical protein
MAQTDKQAKERAGDSEERLLVALFAREKDAETALRRLTEADFPMDMISLLGHGQSSGDDLLGLYYPSAGERMRGWGRAGAIWGGLWGLLSGAAGMFLVPGVGPVLAAGPIVEALVGGLAGAGLTGGVMAGAAAVTQVSVALHRSGVPEDRLESMHQALLAGDCLLMLRSAAAEADRWIALLWHAGARETGNFPYTGITTMVG